MKIRHVGTKMLMVLVISVIVAGVISAAVTYIGGTMIIDNSVSKNTDTSVKLLYNTIDDVYNEMIETSFKIANTYEIQKALESKDQNLMDSTIIDVCQSNVSSASFTSLFDANGNELARFEGGYSHERSDDFSKNSVIMEAISGKKVCKYTEGFGSDFVICAATPITDNNGKVAGGIAMIYRLDNLKMLDELKELTGAEYSIFKSDKRVNTTLADWKGQRQLGTEMDIDVMDKVIGAQEEYISKIPLFGKHYNVKYMPIVQDGKVIGAVFSGNVIDDIETQQLYSLILSIIVIILICVLSSFVSFSIVKKVVVKPLQDIGEIVQNIAQGKLKGKLIEVKGYDEISELAKNTNITAVNLSRYINDIIIKVDALASKDITIEFEENYVGDYVKIENSLKKITDVMNKTFQAILVSCDQVSIGSEQIAMGAQALAQGSTTQAGAVQELSNTVRRLNNGVKENVIGVERVSNRMNETKEKIQAGTDKMTALLESMAQITSSTNQISSVIRVIDDISFQTNILALNAAVEAESAGEAGKGFAVVATEVQKLSEKTAAAVKETDALINQSIYDVKKGSTVLKDTATAIETVRYEIENINTLMAEILETFKVEIKDIEEITRESENITQVIQNNSATSEESAAASEELSGQAALLRDKLLEFNLREEENDLDIEENLSKLKNSDTTVAHVEKEVEENRTVYDDFSDKF